MTTPLIPFRDGKLLFVGVDNLIGLDPDCCCTPASGCNALFEDNFYRGLDFSGDPGSHWTEVSGTWSVGADTGYKATTADADAVLEWADAPGGTVRPLGILLAIANGHPSFAPSVINERKIYIARQDADNTYCVTLQPLSIFANVIISKIIAGVETILQRGLFYYDSGNMGRQLSPETEFGELYNFGISLGEKAFSATDTAPINKFCLEVFTRFNPEEGLNAIQQYGIPAFYISVEVDPEELTTNGVAIGTGQRDSGVDIFANLDYYSIRVYKGRCFLDENCVTMGAYNSWWPYFIPLAGRFEVPFAYPNAKVIQAETGSWNDTDAVSGIASPQLATAENSSRQLWNRTPDTNGFGQIWINGTANFKIEFIDTSDPDHNLWTVRIKPNVQIDFSLGDLTASIKTDGTFTLNDGSSAIDLLFARGEIKLLHDDYYPGVSVPDGSEDHAWGDGRFTISICRTDEQTFAHLDFSSFGYNDDITLPRGFFVDVDTEPTTTTALGSAPFISYGVGSGDSYNTVKDWLSPIDPDYFALFQYYGGRSAIADLCDCGDPPFKLTYLIFMRCCTGLVSDPITGTLLPEFPLYVATSILDLADFDMTQVYRLETVDGAIYCASVYAPSDNPTGLAATIKTDGPYDDCADCLVPCDACEQQYPQYVEIVFPTLSNPYDFDILCPGIYAAYNALYANTHFKIPLYTGGCSKVLDLPEFHFEGGVPGGCATADNAKLQLNLQLSAGADGTYTIFLNLKLGVPGSAFTDNSYTYTQNSPLNCIDGFYVPQSKVNNLGPSAPPPINFQMGGVICDDDLLMAKFIEQTKPNRQSKSDPALALASQAYKLQPGMSACGNWKANTASKVWAWFHQACWEADKLATFEERSARMKKILAQLTKLTTCDECVTELKNYLSTKSYIDGESCFVYSVAFHNHVNAKLGKPIVSLEQATAFQQT